jgi:hypothetical protein
VIKEIFTIFGASAASFPCEQRATRSPAGRVAYARSVGLYHMGQLSRTTALNLVIPSGCDEETVHCIAPEIRTGPWEKNFRLLHHR